MYVYNTCNSGNVGYETFYHILCAYKHGVYTLLWCFVYRVPWQWKTRLNHQIWRHKTGKRCIGIHFITLMQKYNVQVQLDRYIEIDMSDCMNVERPPFLFSSSAPSSQLWNVKIQFFIWCTLLRQAFQLHARKQQNSLCFATHWENIRPIQLNWYAFLWFTPNMQVRSKIMHHYFFHQDVYHEPFIIVQCWSLYQNG